MAVTLRDAQHAHRFYKANTFAHAPKVKFLYHIVFTLTDTGLGWSYAMQNYGREISVLVKSADLPSFSASIETKKQYNRVKHLQTRVDYDPVAIRFHDDNMHITSQLLEDYYTYYFRDGLQRNADGSKRAYDPRDKYAENVPIYGLEKTPKPFFKDIKIFQLSRQSWRAYTLVNPLVEKWQHDSVDAAEGAGIMENSLSVVYESVLYSQGTVTEGSDPAGFGAQETLYDVTPSPIGQNSNSSASSVTKDNNVVNSRTPIEEATLSRQRPTNELSPLLNDTTANTPQQGPASSSFPRNNGNPTVTQLATQNEVPNLNPDTVGDELREVGARGDFIKLYLLNNLDGGDGDYADFKTLNPGEKRAYIDEVVAGLDSDPKGLQLASRIVAKRREKQGAKPSVPEPTRSESDNAVLNDSNLSNEEKRDALQASANSSLSI